MLWVMGFRSAVDCWQHLALRVSRNEGPPSFFGRIGQRVTDAAAEGGVPVVFEV